MDSSPSFDLFTILPILMSIIYLLLTGLGIYCLILFIRLGHRGIKALDIYINEKKNRSL